ncbi:maleate cis-trans isomerase family protein [Roseobacter weihaiensis]|uniref:maleate cis-trans isomerase family protein n=1 Tax=Roseobacter weihaiensis TaxID=2763262 RepID=UPI001D0B6263|nr:Asp/Glu racemase [Roseobacter sp. H9]
MNARPFPYRLAEITAPRLGLIALQSDETVEGDLRRLLPPDCELMVSRVPSAREVTSGSLAAMEDHLTASAKLFPAGLTFDVIGYGCTSASAQIGPGAVADKIRTGAPAHHITEPLSSLIAACRYLGLSRVALLSPYIAQVSERLSIALAKADISTPVFGSFNVAEEASVVRIEAASIMSAAKYLMADAEVDALFLSCTNLRTLESIAPLEALLGKPVLASNQVLAWHMMRLAGLAPPAAAPGQLFGR